MASTRESFMGRGGRGDDAPPRLGVKPCRAAPGKSRGTDDGKPVPVDFGERYGGMVAIALGRNQPCFAEARSIIDCAEAEWAKRDEPAADDPLDLPLAELEKYGAAVRAINSLEEEHGAVYVRDLLAIPMRELVRTPNLGETYIREILLALWEVGVPGVDPFMPIPAVWRSHEKIRRNDVADRARRRA